MCLSEDTRRVVGQGGSNFESVRCGDRIVNELASARGRVAMFSYDHDYGG